MNTLSPEMLSEIFKQESGDCFLTLMTLDHESMDQPIRLVNNTENIVSNGETFLAFPFKIVLPVDDGESAREVSVELDNVSLELIETLRTITDPLQVKFQMILGSIPDDIQVELDELFLGTITFDSQKISGRLYQDNFMTSALTSERYTPNNFPGLFG